jgi:hypothetical protein
MANPADILNDPDFVSANAATKQAIFAKHVATDPDFLKANADTQQAIKLRFGFAGNEGMPGARQGVDQFGIPVTIRQPQTEAPLTLREKISGAIETPVALAANLVSGPITYLAGAGGPEFQKKVAGEIQYQPRTRLAQQALETVGQGLEASKIPPFMPMIGGTANALAPAARAAPAVAENALAAARATPLVQAVEAPLVARAAAKQEANVAKSYQNAGRIEAVNEGSKIGLVANPAEMNPTLGNRVTAFVTDPKTINDAATKSNAAQVPKIALNEMGLPPNTALNSEAPFAAAREAASGPYKEVAKLPSMTAAPDVVKTVESLRPSKLVLGKDRAAALNEIIDTSIQDMSNGLTGAETVKSISDLRAQAQNISNSQKAGHPLAASELDKVGAYRGIANALEQMVEDNVTDPKLLKDLRDARLKIAKIHAYEDATDFNTGQINPAKLAKLTAENSKLTGDIATVGRFAGNFPEAMGLTTPESVAAMAKRTLSRATMSGAAGAAVGSAIPGVGTAAGLAIGAGAGELGSQFMAKRMVSPSYQAANAIPKDYRPLVNQLTPAEINYGPNQLTPFDPRNAVLMPGEGAYFPNFTRQTEPTFGAAPSPYAQRALPNEIPKQVYQAQKNAELAQEFQSAAERKPTSGGSVLEFDPITGTYKVGGAGVKGATPEVFMSDTGRNLNTASQKVAAGQNFALSAAEKVAWEKTKVDLAAAAPELKGLSDKAIANKIMDREWADGAITKARQQAQAFDEIAARATTDQARRMAEMKREQMLDVLNTLEDQLRAPRPTSLGGQGPKTRAAIRNKLAPQDTGNAQFNFLSGQ